MVKKLLLYSMLIFMIVLSSCSKYQKLLKSSDNDLKYDKAIGYYEKGEYFRAQQLFEQIFSFFRGTEKAEKIAYLNSYCYYKQKDFIMGGYNFKNFAANYPSSKYAEECAYMSAYCSYLDSPRSSLDPTSTNDAIAALQLFINQHPESERVEECNNLIDELRGKLEKKDYDIATMYYKMADFKAAIITFNNVLKDFPDTKRKEDILFQILLAKYDYAINSVESKKKERLNDALESYKLLTSEFPDGDFTARARSIEKNIMKLM
ncbi:MAG TPA: outer membrane protein assembly factor BamD [Bacteroidales bacterium]|nr:outer membrane protein assembly factor BamD [Bacteroidales bacterium]HPT02283.1 outer membrane protein assembly factor BamD [Bacteroidales bacterium]